MFFCCFLVSRGHQKSSSPSVATTKQPNRRERSKRCWSVCEYAKENQGILKQKTDCILWWILDFFGQSSIKSIFLSKDRKIKEITTAGLRNGPMCVSGSIWTTWTTCPSNSPISLAMIRVTPSEPSLKSIHGSNSAACLRATGFFGWGCFFESKKWDVCWFRKFLKTTQKEFLEDHLGDFIGQYYAQ